MITFEILLTPASNKPLAQCISNCVPVREPVYRLQLFFRFGILYDTTLQTSTVALFYFRGFTLSGLISNHFRKFFCFIF